MEEIVFFFNDTATTEIYTLSLHDALPICLAHRLGRAHPLSQRASVSRRGVSRKRGGCRFGQPPVGRRLLSDQHRRSEEHTSEIQLRQYLVCRLLLEKKKHKSYNP